MLVRQWLIIQRCPLLKPESPPLSEAFYGWWVHYEEQVRMIEVGKPGNPGLAAWAVPLPVSHVPITLASDDCNSQSKSFLHHLSGVSRPLLFLLSV